MPYSIHSTHTRTQIVISLSSYLRVNVFGKLNSPYPRPKPLFMSLGECDPVPLFGGKQRSPSVMAIIFETPLLGDTSFIFQLTESRCHQGGERKTRT